jgi:hypothetical protein
VACGEHVYVVVALLQIHLLAINKPFLFVVRRPSFEGIVHFLGVTFLDSVASSVKPRKLSAKLPILEHHFL